MKQMYNITFARSPSLGGLAPLKSSSPRVKPISQRPKPPASRTRPEPSKGAGEWAWHYRTLLALHDHLKGGVGDRLRESSAAMEPPSLHAEDLTDELYDRELVLALPADRAEALQEINHALQRIRSKEYGGCEATGRKIPKAQLREMPWRRFAQGMKTPPLPDSSNQRRPAATRKRA